MESDLKPKADQAWQYLQWLMPGVNIHVERMESVGVELTWMEACRVAHGGVDHG